MTAPDAKQFVKDQFRWLMQVARDRDLPANASAVAIALTQYFNRNTREAWPSQETLAELLGLSDRRIRSTLAAMVNGGYLRPVGAAKGGRNRSNHYCMTLKPGHFRPGLVGETQTISGTNADDIGQKPERDRPTNLLNEPSKEPLRGDLGFEGRQEGSKQEVIRGITAEEAARLVSLSASQRAAPKSYPTRSDYRPLVRVPSEPNVEASLQRLGVGVRRAANG